MRHEYVAVILCGGLGKRLRSVVNDKQKVMANVGDRPFMDLIIDHAKTCGFRNFVLCTGHHSQTVEEYYNRYDPELSFCFSREDQPLGTGGALLNAVKKIKSDPFFVFNGDSFCKVDLNAFIDYHIENKLLGSVVVSEIEDSKDYGSIKLDDGKNIISFDEKIENSETCYVNAGIYGFSAKVFSQMPDKKNFSLEYDVFPKLIERDLKAFVVSEKFYDIGTPERLDKLREHYE